MIPLTRLFMCTIAVAILRSHALAQGTNSFGKTFPVPSSGVDPSAVIIIEMIANDTYLNCGNSWFVTDSFDHTGWGGREYKGKFNFAIETKPITQTDKLNGTSWSYQFTIHFVGATREYEPFNRHWLPWRDSDTTKGSSAPTFRLHQANGKIVLSTWVGVVPLEEYGKKPKISCTTIPK